MLSFKLKKKKTEEQEKIKRKKKEKREKKKKKKKTKTKSYIEKFIYLFFKTFTYSELSRVKSYDLVR